MDGREADPPRRLRGGFLKRDIRPLNTSTRLPSVGKLDDGARGCGRGAIKPDNFGPSLWIDPRLGGQFRLGAGTLALQERSLARFVTEHGLPVGVGPEDPCHDRPCAAI